MSVGLVSLKVDVEANFFATLDQLWWFRLNAGHVDVILLKHTQCVVEYAWLAIFHSQQNRHVVLTLPKRFFSCCLRLLGSQGGEVSER